MKYALIFNMLYDFLMVIVSIILFIMNFNLSSSLYVVLTSILAGGGFYYSTASFLKNIIEFLDI
jgi:hypothetical protein